MSTVGGICCIEEGYSSAFGIKYCGGVLEKANENNIIQRRIF
jgi:hypothetical protein